MELSKRSNAKLEEANEEELRQNKAIGKEMNAGVPFWSRKLIEGVHSHAMDLLRISGFGPLFNIPNFRF